MRRRDPKPMLRRLRAAMPPADGPVGPPMPDTVTLAREMIAAHNIVVEVMQPVGGVCPGAHLRAAVDVARDVLAQLGEPEVAPKAR
jgi:hypothetical protein